MGAVSREDKRRSPIRKIVALGDSITYGMSASSRENNWVSIVKELLETYQGKEIEMLNQGICGNILGNDTPAYEQAGKPTGMERLEKDVISHNPDMVLIAYGLNDSRGGTPLKKFITEYQRMIDRIKDSLSATVVVLNLFYMHECFYQMCEGWDHSNYQITEEYNREIRRLAEQNGLIYADVYRTVKGVDWAVSEDHIHPNDLGHRLIGNCVFEAIMRNCSLAEEQIDNCEENHE